MNLWQLFLQTLRARVLPLFNRLRLFLSPSYIWAQIVNGIRVFFSSILNIRPKDKNDYYTFGKWMVSKRLCFAVVVVLGLLSVLYIYFMRDTLFPGRAGDTIKTYNYNSIMLKFAKGPVRIKGKSGYLAFEGTVEKGSCNGPGTLKNPEGIVVYQGDFLRSMYEGAGTQYYPNGALMYKGSFHENLHSGQGKLYRRNGSIEYDGQFEMDMKEGMGIFYDNANNRVFTGMFSQDEVQYSALIGKNTYEMADAYAGRRIMYQSEDERVRFLPDIMAMTVEYVDEDSIDEEAEVETVYVLKDYFRFGGARCDTIRSLTDTLGAPTYVGTSYVTLPEALVINYLNERDGVAFEGPVEIDTDPLFNEFIQVSGYDKNYEVYLHSYSNNGLVYNFVSDSGSDDFCFYYITAEEIKGEG